MRSELLMSGLLALGLAAPALGAERTDPMSLMATGEPVRCIPNLNVNTTPAGDRVLMFRTSANRWFRNELRAQCPNMNGLNRVLVFRNTQSRHCEMDLFDVVEPQGAGMVLASCTLGLFTPVEVPPGARF
jgi:hypothetical protein